MKASEKETLYNLIKTASQHINGYTPDAFKTTPVFTDDDITSNAKTTDMTQRVTPDTNGMTSNVTPITQTVTPSAQAVTPSAQDITLSTQDVTLSVVEGSPSPLTLSDITNKIARCTRCGLARTRTNTVPSEGVLNPEVMIIGEGPGADEDAQGKPFVGKAGQLLDKMLSSIKLDRHKNCHIANIVKCRPPNNRDPLPDEASACIGFLEAQINILKPKLILCVGKVAAHNLLKNKLSISAMRGKWYDYNGIPVLVTYHPSALLRDESYKKPAWEDLKQFARRLKEMSSSYSELFN